MAASSTQAGADIQHAARHLAEGRPADAIAMLERLVEAFPAYVTGHVLLAKAYETTGRSADALEAWHQAYFLMPASALVVRQRARLLQKTTEFSQQDAFAFGGKSPEVGAEQSAGVGEPAEGTEPAGGATTTAEAPSSPPEVEGATETEAHTEYRQEHEPSGRSDEGEARATAEPPPQEATATDDALATEVMPPMSASSPSVPGPPPEDEFEKEGGWRLLDETERLAAQPEPTTEPPLTSPVGEGKRTPPSGVEAPGGSEWMDDAMFDIGEMTGPEEQDASPPAAQPTPASSEAEWADIRWDEPLADAGPPAAEPPPSEGSQETVSEPALEEEPYEVEVGGFDIGWEETPSTEEEPKDEASGPAEADTEPDFMNLAGDLDSLIEQLERAPRIRPDTPVDEEEDEEGGGGEVVSETLARIYETQQQYAAAARAYALLAEQHPARAEEFEQRAAEMRRRSGD